MDAAELVRQAEEALAQARRLGAQAHPAPSEERRRLRAQLQAVQRALCEPDEAIFLEQHYVARAAAMCALLRLGVVDQLVRLREASVEQLADAARYPHPALIGRLLRILAAADVVTSADGVSYQSTPSLEAYLSPAGAKFVLRSYVLAASPFQYASYVAERDPAQVNDVAHTIFSHIHGQEGQSFFHVLAKDQDMLRVFDRAMNAKEGDRQPVLGLFPFETLAGGAGSDDVPLLVDIAGGDGNALRSILHAHPNFAGRVVLQDLPQVLDAIPKEKLEGIRPMHYDFNDAQPVEGARAYHLRRVLHDHPDELCRDILRNTASAMAPDSTLLIADLVMPEVPSALDLDLVVLTVSLCQTTTARRRMH